MGKISPVSAKYIVHAKIEADGVIEKPDVIGAIFGQTEGLLGSELELRELQKSGRIGRIDAELEVVEGKTKGIIGIPSSLNKEETAIIAAALETIQRIGPCEARITIKNIEDVRVVKRDYLMQRAKELLKTMMDKEMPDSQEITNDVKSSMRTRKATTYGKEGLTAGPDIDRSDEIIIVEGRADVLTLLQHGITNAISLDGTSVPDTIITLCKSKKATVFVDGDRGGDMIVKEMLMRTEVAHIATAPAGKEVEELTGKEIHQCLRARKPAREKPVRRTATRTRTPTRDRRPRTSSRGRPSSRDRGPPRGRSRTYSRDRPGAPIRGPRISADAKKKFKTMLDELGGTKGAYILDKGMNILGKVPVKELPSTIKDLGGVHAIVMDGEVTQPLVNEAEPLGVSYLVGKTKSGRSRKVKTIAATDLN